jgi:carbamoyl-phosphate synthase large subunit
MNILITGACGVTPRAIARSLSRSKWFKNARLVGTDLCHNLYGLYEGLFDCVYKVHPPNDPAYPGLINSICEREKIELAIVSPESEVIFWASHPKPVPILLPPLEFCKISISKRKLYEVLDGTEFVPSFRIVKQSDIVSNTGRELISFPVWARDCSEVSSSGKGAMYLQSLKALKAWALLNKDIEEFMISEYLPGRNYACCLLFDHGKLLKVAIYERIEYFMSKVVMSGISGNISKGRLINDSKVYLSAEQAVQFLCKHTGEEMCGLVTVDLKENRNGIPLVTEINLRHVAATSAFTDGGANMAEAQVLATQGRTHLVGDVEVIFPENNLILRDIDGLPIVTFSHRDKATGEAYSS